MSPLVLLLFVVGYFAALIGVSYFTSRNSSDNSSFFIANRNSKWYFVAFGMIGTALSGVTFISVPGAVKGSGFGYFQFVLGNAVGFVIVAYVLLPLYYKLNLVSIYTYLEKRFGYYSYKTGSVIFIVSRVIGSAFRLYLVAIVFQRFIFDALHVPFGVTVALYLILIWSYTFKGGLKTIIITDTLQTVFLLLSVVLSIYFISESLHLNIGQTFEAVKQSSYSKMFFWEDLAGSKNHFLKQFLGGVFVTISMTGLDQDLMQKNLSCKNIGEAQKNMLTFTIVFVVINLFFLSVGALLYQYAAANHIDVNAMKTTDHLFPEIALRHLNVLPATIFMLGLTAATFATTDSALTALTTSFCIDFLKFDKSKDQNSAELVKKRHLVHVGFSVVVLLVILVFRALNDDSVVNGIFKAAGYTYGPLLGLFAFGIMTEKGIADKAVPVICLLSPVLSFFLEKYLLVWFGYAVGFELIVLNGLITFLLLLISTQLKTNNTRPVAKAVEFKGA
ncbi:sodium:solute symporter [Mucilaginibacter sp. RS28]|uniref:Sodium:solute symporter n=1 Tax=Mucilaginibacter straminoryzae TaxID=2932774 RepID=A0A9X1X1C7_9SPHI|nr:sodium:solute symporter [Mucilaginibacter straminoryzae]MCJ8209243.1 sodium:solute symporter [Mucilaginibacter straminoryzae]